MRTTHASFPFAMALLLALACDDFRVADFGLPAAGGGLPITVLVSPGVDPAAVEIRLDGEDVRPLFAVASGGLAATLPLPSPGTHELAVTQYTAGLIPLLRRKFFEVPAAAPALAGVSPGAGPIPATSWLRFDFAEDVEPEMLVGFAFGMACGAQAIPHLTHAVEPRSVVLDPIVELPAGPCRVVWRDAAGATERTFSVAAPAAVSPAAPIYDRDSAQSFAPFPDDWWTEADAGTATGLRIAFHGPTFDDLRDLVVGGIAASMADLDGWSPIGPIVLSLSHAVDTSLLPADEFAAQHPFSPLAILDADPSSPDYGARIPFTVEVRDDPAPDGSTDHTLILFPAVTLRPHGRYAVVVTQRLFAAGDPSRPFRASPFFERAIAEPTPATTPDEARIRAAVTPLLDFLESVPAVPIYRNDVALVLRLSTRSTLRDPSDMVAIKENAVAAPPPASTVASVTSSSQRRLIVRGTLALPSYLGDPDASVLTRDESGRPLAVVTEDVPFTMTLPNQALSGPVPIAIFQHGSPGTQEDVLSVNNEFLDNEGYAIVGIQDTANRRYGDDSTLQTIGVLLHLIEHGHIPLLELQTHADLQSLLRALEDIAAQDWLPNGAPDGILELDTSRIVYRGVSFGAHHSLGFLPFAPEVRAAASIVGGGRFFENSIHQIDHYGVLDQIQAFLEDLRPIELLVGLAALQNEEDRQDPHLLARHLYRERLPIAGIDPSAPPPSLLWTEGIGDHVVSNNATRAAARELGIPQVERVKRASPGLEQVAAPLSGNVGGTRTAGHFQFVPGSTPSCANAVPPLLEGHHCPQRATEGRQQILHFFSTALAGGAPEIVDPLP
jgi:hypothetical protein